MGWRDRILEELEGEVFSLSMAIVLVAAVGGLGVSLLRRVVRLPQAQGDPWGDPLSPDDPSPWGKPGVRRGDDVA